MLRDALGFHIPFVPWSVAERYGHNYEASTAKVSTNAVS